MLKRTFKKWILIFWLHKSNNKGVEFPIILPSNQASPWVPNTYPAEFSFPAPLKGLDLTGSKSIKEAGYEKLEAVGN